MDGKPDGYFSVNHAYLTKFGTDHARVGFQRHEGVAFMDYVSPDRIGWYRHYVRKEQSDRRWNQTSNRAKMIKRNQVLMVLAALGVLCFYGAHKMLQLSWIVDDTFFALYSIGIMLWSFRIRLQNISLADSLVGNIIMWLCIFNVLDELFSSNPVKPYRPYIVTIIVIITSTYIYTRQCKKERTNSKN